MDHILPHWHDRVTIARQKSYRGFFCCIPLAWHANLNRIDKLLRLGVALSNLARFAALPEFPFRRLATMLEGIDPAAGMAVLDLSIGEPKHAPPAILAQTVAQFSNDWNRYPPPGGTLEFKSAAAKWLEWRFDLVAGSVDPNKNVLPLAGTKEGLFLLPAVAGEAPAGLCPAILMPHPLYAVYLGGAVMANCEPVLLPALHRNNFLPDLDQIATSLLRRTVMCFICNPSNPQGAIASREYIEHAVSLARLHNFTLVLDECYSELYDQSQPAGGLSVAQSMNGNFDSVVVMHSLSKRSNAAGLRSGFVAGDEEILRRFIRLRAYGGAVQPLPLMAAATALWQDEEHVEANRLAYRRKIDLAQSRLGNRFGFFRPPGGFFLWLDVGDGVHAARRLWAEAALKVLPGTCLTASIADTPPDDDPGHAYIRLALVHDEDTISQALDRLIDVLG